MKSRWNRTTEKFDVGAKLPKEIEPFYANCQHSITLYIQRFMCVCICVGEWCMYILRNKSSYRFNASDGLCIYMRMRRILARLPVRSNKFISYSTISPNASLYIRLCYRDEYIYIHTYIHFTVYIKFRLSIYLYLLPMWVFHLVFILDISIGDFLIRLFWRSIYSFFTTYNSSIVQWIHHSFIYQFTPTVCIYYTYIRPYVLECK